MEFPSQVHKPRGRAQGYLEPFYTIFAVHRVRLSIQERAAALVLANEMRHGGQRDAITHRMSTHSLLGLP